MFHLFHKWSKWAVVECTVTDGPLTCLITQKPPRTYIAEKQIRKCQKCGETQVKNL